MSLVPDFAEPLRCEAHERADRLAVYHPDLDQVVEVFNSHGERAVPIHCPLPTNGLPFGLHVRGLPLSVWMVAPQSVPDARYTGLYFRFVDMVAYWVWQLTPGLVPHLSAVAEQMERLIIELELRPGEGWFVHTADPVHDDTANACSMGRERVRVTIGPGLMSRFASGDNAGERQVVRALLGGLRDWGQRLRVSSLGNLTDGELWDLVNQHAPLGQKKKLLMLNSDRHPELNDTGLPLYRPVQAFDEQQVLDAVGHMAGWQFGIEPEEVPDDRRIALLNGLVGYLYGDLERLVASLAPDDVLEKLVAQNERVIYERQHLELTIPTRMACFGEHSSVVERLCEELPEIATAAVAGRFLIEYVVARPPAGTRAFSLSVYDRLLALAAQIISFGMSSDALRYGLSNRPFEMLRSGRLAVGESHFEATLDDFRAAYAQDVAGHSQTAFDGYWSTEPARRSPEVEQLRSQMDSAAAEEFGFSLLELNQFLGEVMAAGVELPGEPKSLAVNALLERLTTGLGWGQDRVTRAFDLFVLRPRPDFLTPPDGFDRAEVFPWRFNRRLSHVRRPLLIRSGAVGDEVVWGDRTVRMAAGYLTSLCTGGRLIARTRAMRQAMGAFHTYHGREFNRRVAELYRAAPGLLVCERVKKIGRLRIARPNGQDLGDLDVLVANPHIRSLTPVETKDLTAALTPPELRNEMDRLFGSADNRPGDLDRFAERVGWVRANVGEVLRHVFRITDDPSDWTVHPTLVLDREMISPRLARRPDLTVLSLRELQAGLRRP
jgi:hypothetical protein